MIHQPPPQLAFEFSGEDAPQFNRNNAPLQQTELVPLADTYVPAFVLNGEVFFPVRAFVQAVTRNPKGKLAGLSRKRLDARQFVTTKIMQSGREGWIECFSYVAAIAYLTNKTDDAVKRRAEQAARDLASVMDSSDYATLLSWTDLKLPKGSFRGLTVDRSKLSKLNKEAKHAPRIRTHLIHWVDDTTVEAFHHWDGRLFVMARGAMEKAGYDGISASQVISGSSRDANNRVAQTEVLRVQTPDHDTNGAAATIAVTLDGLLQFLKCSNKTDQANALRAHIEWLKMQLPRNRFKIAV